MNHTKKRLAILATAALCTLTISLTTMAALPVFAEVDLPAEDGAEGGEAGDAVERELDPSWENLALNATPSTNTSHMSWSIYGVIDGQTTVGNNLSGWHSDKTIEISDAKPAHVTLLFAGDVMVHAIRLHPLLQYAGADISAMPQAFTVEVSADKENWQVIATETGLSCLTDEPLTYFLDEPTAVRAVRLVATAGGDYFEPAGKDPFVATGLAEFEVWGNVIIPETEPETEPATEPETDPVTEPETEPETTAAEETSADAETTAAETTALDTAVAEETAGDTTVTATEPAEGCTSAVGLGAFAVLTAAAAAVALRKKD